MRYARNCTSPNEELSRPHPSLCQHLRGGLPSCSTNVSIIVALTIYIGYKLPESAWRRTDEAAIRHQFSAFGHNRERLA